jgi:hypothetical protein
MDHLLPKPPLQFVCRARVNRGNLYQASPTDCQRGRSPYRTVAEVRAPGGRHYEGRPARRRLAPSTPLVVLVQRDDRPGRAAAVGA